MLKYPFKQFWSETKEFAAVSWNKLQNIAEQYFVDAPGPDSAVESLAGDNVEAVNSQLFRQMQTLLKKLVYSQSQLTLTKQHLFYEEGRLQEGGRYFFVQPKNNRGWLVQQTADGWEMSSATRQISNQDFIKSALTLDRVRIQQNPQTSSVFLNSEQWGDQLSFNFYCEFLIKFFKQES